MIARIRRWLARPAPDAPASETLRWIRRLAVALATVSFVTAAPRLLLGSEDLGWLGLGAGGLMLISAALLTVAIRAVQRREQR